MSRNTQRSVELYDTLTNKQKAAVFIELVAARDGEEIERLESKVERKVYRQLDGAYQDWGRCFMQICGIIGMDFWRQCFLHAYAMLRANAESVPEAAQQAFGKTLALQLVLKELCHQHGFNYEAACEIATLPNEPLINAPELADQDYYSKMLADLEECLPAA